MDRIVAHDLTKTYRLGVGRARVRDMMPWPIDAAFAAALPRWWSRNTFKALDGVTLHVPAGSSVGIVGHNGAGKTTLLKVLSGVTAPTEGSVALSGRIAALIDVMVGFHPDLTGRENVYLLGAIHGFGRRAMSERVEQILAFAEIDQLADTPLKRYSAGMAARLGFATITALDVDVLLVDEILAVGDANFQKKCVMWLDGFRQNGGTLLFVSHNLALVRSMTERAVWLDRGRVVQDGPTPVVLAAYAKAMERRDDAGSYRGRESAKGMRARGLHRWGAGGARVDAVHLEERSAGGSAIDVSITYEAAESFEAVFCVGFLDDGGAEVCAAQSAPISVEPGEGTISCRIDPLLLRSGIYFPVVAIVGSDGQVRDRWRLDRAVVVDRDGEVDPGDGFGRVLLESSWRSAAERTGARGARR